MEHRALLSVASNLAREVGPLVPGANIHIRDRLTPGARRDDFNFRLDAPAVVAARVSGLKSDARLMLLDATGRSIATSDRPGRSDEAVALSLTPGSYSIRVIGRGRASTRYALSLGAESIPPPAPNPTPTPEPPVPIPTPIPTPPASSARLVERADGVVYVPSGLESGRAYPLLVVYDPGGNGRGSVDRLVTISEREKWVVYGSSYFHNDHPDVWEDLGGPAYSTAKGQLEGTIRAFPVDASRVIMTGFSGGGSFAYAMNFRYPGLASTLIINTAMIWGFEVPDTGGMNGPDWYRFGQDNADVLAPAYARSSRRLAVFLASPGDFRYEEMHRDADLFMGRLGWSTKWIEFVGGHALAPDEAYRAAIDWIKGQPSWQ